jgi:hypothetical protein
MMHPRIGKAAELATTVEQMRRRATPGRCIERRASARPLSGAEQCGVVELLCTGIERLLKRRGDVDLSPELSVDADAPEEDARCPR